MTIGASNRNDAIGNGSTPTYDYGFKVFAATQLRVTVRDPETDTETQLTYPTHYTVANVGRAAGGTITLVAGAFDWLDVDDNLDDGWQISIRRVVPVTQTTDVRNQGGFFADVHEDEFDYLTMIDQQQQDELDRAFRLPETADPDTFDTTMPVPENNAVLMWQLDDDDVFRLINVEADDFITAAVSETKRVDLFEDGVDFTAGTTTTLTLSEIPGAKENLTITFDGVEQHIDTFSVSGATVTFSSAIPIGTLAVQARYSRTLTVSVGASENMTFEQAGTGAATRSAQDKMRETVSVTDFLNDDGTQVAAMGNTRDNTTGIQKALNTGKDVFAPGADDYYKITADVAMLDYQRFYGESERSQIRQATSLENVVSATSKTGVTIEKLRLYCVGDMDSLTEAGGVLLSGTDKSVVRDCIVENCRAWGVTINNGNDNVVEANTFINAATSSITDDEDIGGDIQVIRTSNRNRIINNSCISGTGVGIKIQSVEDGDITNDNIVMGNNTKDNLIYGIIAYRNSQSLPVLQECYRNIIANNVVDGVAGSVANSIAGTYTYGAGIYLQGAEDAVVSGNTVKDTHNGGVSFAETLAPGAIGATNLIRFSISNNVIEECGMFGIDVGDANNFGSSIGFGSVTDNVVTSCVKSGINVRNRSRVKVSGNTVDTTGLSGIRVNNTVSAREQISVTNNMVRNTTGTANIEVNFADGVVISGNNVDTSTVHGIVAANSVAPIVSGNVIKNHTTRGIQITSTCSQGSVLNNYIEGTGASTSGIQLDVATRYAGNDISGCTSVYAGNFAPFHTLTVNSTTPAIDDGTEFITNNTNPTTITNFTGGYDGQEILVVFTDANTTLDFTASNLKGNVGVDRAMAAGDAIKATFRAGGVNVWYVTIIDIA